MDGPSKCLRPILTYVEGQHGLRVGRLCPCCQWHFQRLCRLMAGHDVVAALGLSGCFRGMAHHSVIRINH